MQLILLNTGFYHTTGEWNWKEISSPFARLFYVKEGKARIKLPSSANELKPGHLYLIPPYTLHSYECNDFFSHYYIHVYEKTDSLPMLEELDFPVEIKAKPIDSLLVERLLELNPDRQLKQFDPHTYNNRPNLLRNIAATTLQPPYALIETGGILSQLFSRFLEHAQRRQLISDLRIVKVMDYIRQNIHKTMRVKEFSSLCHLSEDHFIRLFKKELECTPVHYINRKKIEKSQLMLLIHSTPIKEIAYSLSFDNLSYFNRVFKQFTGFSPTAYRKLLKGN